MRILSWNVNSVRSRLDRLLKVLERHSPDVVCLQELKCETDKFPALEISAAGYEASVYGQKTWNGVAILTKKATVHPVHGFPLGWDSESSRLTAIQVEGLHVLSAYVPNGQEVGSEKFRYKLEWMKKLKETVAALPPAKGIVIAGDFNVAPEDRDCYNPKAWEGQVLFTEEEKAAFRDFLSLGFRDTFRLHHSEGGLYSWWDYRMLGFPKNRGMRIDFVLCSQNLAERCKAAGIDREERKGEKPSDHAPVWADFDL